jgi:hypothetical protein
MSEARREIASRMAGAAKAFVDSLEADQRALAAWPFPSDDERHRWFYTPTDHGGVTMGSLRPAQQQLAMRLVASGLSRPGYVTVATIIGLENVLDELEGWSAGWGRERGRDPGLYYVRVFGDPGAGEPWSWRFGGHHVSIHHLVVDGEVRASTPLFFGADPASSPLLGPHALRPLEGAEDLGRELVRSLNDAQRARAIVSEVAPVDLVTGNRPTVKDGDLPPVLADVWRHRFEGELGTLVQKAQERAERAAGLEQRHLEAVRISTSPKGLPASSFTAAQRGILRALLDVYVRRIPDELAEQEAAKYSGDAMSSLTFAWAGSTEPGHGHYYRVQGPRLLLEYDNTQRGANHIHSVWRDPEGDFGDDVLLEHYRTAHAVEP